MRGAGSYWGNEKNCIILKITKMRRIAHSKGWILWRVNYIAIKLSLKREKKKGKQEEEEAGGKRRRRRRRKIQSPTNPSSGFGVHLFKTMCFCPTPIFQLFLLHDFSKITDSVSPITSANYFSSLECNSSGLKTFRQGEYGNKVQKLNVFPGPPEPPLNVRSFSDYFSFSLCLHFVIS